MTAELGKYDDTLSSILVEQKSIIGFLATVFEFLARRTDFYYVPKGPYENLGFPPGVAEELTVKVLRKCDPKRPRDIDSVSTSPTNLNDDILCSTVAQEVEIEAEDDEDDATIEPVEESKLESNADTVHSEVEAPVVTCPPGKVDCEAKIAQSGEPASVEDEPPDLPPVQRNSEAYNGAVRGNYSWAQTIMDLDVTVQLPAGVKSSKDLRVNITSTELCVECIWNKELILKGNFSYKVKPLDTFWSLSEGRLLIHLEKQQERWWNALVTSEEPIDLSKIDCSRPLDELPEDHVAKVRQLQWNHERKMRGLPTSDELRKMEVLKKAWDMDGSPFKGKPFDPSVLKP